jgi:hypothetical protein
MSQRKISEILFKNQQLTRRKTGVQAIGTLAFVENAININKPEWNSITVVGQADTYTHAKDLDLGIHLPDSARDGLRQPRKPGLGRANFHAPKSKTSPKPRTANRGETPATSQVIVFYTGAQEGTRTPTYCYART